MAADTSGRTGGDGRAARSGWRPWLPVAGIALALLAASEGVWLWQTWPVRELLRAVPVAGNTSGPT